MKNFLLQNVIRADPKQISFRNLTGQVFFRFFDNFLPVGDLPKG